MTAMCNGCKGAIALDGVVVHNAGFYALAHTSNLFRREV